MKLHPRIKNGIAVASGILIGSFVNMGFISISSSIIPPPKNADITTIEGLKATMHLFQPKHFLFPFLAHALGTLVGSNMASRIAVSHPMRLAMLIGIFFLIGGIANVFMLPSPLWFTITDLVGAYLPMAYLGWKITQNKIN
jgi:hypothetical protein